MAMCCLCHLAMRPPSISLLGVETVSFAILVSLSQTRGSCPRIATTLARINTCRYPCASLCFLPFAGAILLPCEVWRTGLPRTVCVSLMGVEPNLLFMVHHVTTRRLAWLIWSFHSPDGEVSFLANVPAHGLVARTVLAKLPRCLAAAF